MTHMKPSHWLTSEEPLVVANANKLEVLTPALKLSIIPN